MKKTAEATANTETTKKKGSWKRKLLFIFGGILIISIAAGSYVVFGSFSEGYRAGTVMKLSKKGLIFKTLEGQLNMGGAAGNEGSDIASAVWAFSVDRGDEQVVKAIEDAVDSGSRVKLYYREKFYQFNWRGDTKYFVFKVEQIGGTR